MLPEGWKHTAIEDHIDLLSGFPFKSDQYTSSEKDIRLLRGDNIEPGSLRWRDVKRWSVTQYEELKKYHLKKGDFVIAMDRTWVSAGLKVAEIKEYDTPCLLVQRVARIRSKSTLAQNLLKQIFSSHNFEQYVKSVQTETAVPHISSQQIKEFQILLPPRDEQIKIAKILSTWDKAIEITEKILANSQQQKKALMQQLLTGRKRLNGFSGEWNEKSLKQLCKIDKGEQLNRDTLDEIGKYPVINGGITPSGYSDKFNSEANTVTISEGGNSCGFVSFLRERFWCGGHCYALLDPSVPVEFLYHILKFHENKIMRLRVGSGLPNVQKKDIDVLKLYMPIDKSEQISIAKVISSADFEVDIIRNRLSCLQQEKKALMQVLLTGKKRVMV